MLTRRKFMTLTASGLALTALPARSAELATYGGPAFGSYWRLSLAQPFAEAEISRQINQVIRETDALFSPYLATSALSVVNKQDGTDWIALPPALEALLAEGLDLAARSDGAFDPTVGPRVAHYGFGPIEGVAGNYQELTLAPGKLRKARAGLTLDLCGIAKGHALDLMRTELAAMGVADYMLDLGGEVTSHGLHPDGRPWQVGVETPGEQGLAHLLDLKGQTIATSGLGVQAYKSGGRTFGHIINPFSDGPNPSRTLSVSVISANTAFADGWATALMAVAEEQAIAMAERESLNALFLLRDGDKVQPVYTGDFTRFVIA
ncbi:FAD:protein FMN transferase [Maritalea myrionectae]|uniref:FAD:protein FMN transferase n=1 Tax=Maritalea myrionectae TaxID=454601 RepID=UPI00041DCA03|nr:FAD:protein FMN transferase [Maritalea myrionectae]